jgi:hypothetical protein
MQTGEAQLSDLVSIAGNKKSGNNKTACIKCGYALVYGFCNGNSQVALRQYQHQYLDWRLPYRRVLERVHPNLRETGTLMTHEVAGC